MALVKWVKITTDMFDNRKIKHLRRLPDGNSIVLIWVMLITMAGRCNANGMIFLTEDIPYTPKMLADELDFEENTVQLALDALQRLNMIVIKDGFYSIAGWEEHQNTEGLDKIRESKRLAQARWRAKQKALPEKTSVDSTVDSTRHLVDDAEEDIEEDKDKEKEYHSFNLADKNSFSDDFVEKTVENSKRSFLQGSLGKGVVLLSDEQLDDLLDKLSIDEFNKYVSIVADNELSGKRYRKKTHYQAIIDMAMQDRKLR